MKTVRTHPKHSVISVRGLIVLYFLLCTLTILFSRNFFSEILQEGRLPGVLNIIVFLTIPAVLLIFFAISAASLFRDITARRSGSKFKARLLAYFTVIVIFAAAPVTIVTGLTLNELLVFWRAIDTGAAMAAAESFAVDNYSLHLEKLERLAEQTNFDPYLTRGPEGRADALPREWAAVQDFTRNSEGAWEGLAFAGEIRLALRTPPGVRQGAVPRELPRDNGIIRYVTRPKEGLLRIVSYNLGEDFDHGKTAIENSRIHFDVIDSLRANLRPLVIFYYGLFFFPTLLMTIIVAISFTHRVTSPLEELTEATRRIAEGDFSIQILSRRGDELGLLIRSFNAMVQDLEKSRTALLKAEKISIWQNMAQQLAHEIKNPLTPIKLSAERVLRRWRSEPERISEILESSMLAIIQETEGISTLLTEFRTLSRPTEPSQTWTDLKEAAKEIIAPYKNSYPGVHFATEHMGRNILVKIDKHRITQILTNLVINAMDAMEGHGTIEMRTDLVKKRESRYCRFSIRDTGKGITKQEGFLIFTPYFTTKESGTGLGLPIVERIVNDHGGVIWFNSAEGTGTTFFIDLPIDETSLPDEKGLE
jgi:nitrogen fixation/metabolism regulation signal transduction histidine kinase